MRLSHGDRTGATANLSWSGFARASLLHSDAGEHRVRTGEITRGKNIPRVIVIGRPNLTRATPHGNEITVSRPTRCHVSLSSAMLLFAPRSLLFRWRAFPPSDVRSHSIFFSAYTPSSSTFYRCSRSTSPRSYEMRIVLVNSLRSRVSCLIIRALFIGGYL